jgi:hypothetical protein
MHRKFLLVFLTAIISVVAATSGAGDGDNTNDILILPEDFDMSAHPALNITLLRKLHDRNATLPELDEASLTEYIHKQPSNTTVGAMAVITEKLFCEATAFVSPWYVQVQMNAKYLFSLGNAWCCMETKGKQCQLMALTSSAASDICGKYTTCVRCKWAAQANMDVSEKCRDGVWCGGYKR